MTVAARNPVIYANRRWDWRDLWPCGWSSIIPLPRSLYNRKRFTLYQSAPSYRLKAREIYIRIQ